MECISYKAGYKYQLFEEYCTDTPLQPEEDIVSNSDYISLSTTGTIVINKGYAWDGPSGPTIDTLNFMRASLVHDALYQLMRENKLEPSRYQNQADRLLQKMCTADGMSAVRAWWIYQAVSKFGSSASSNSQLNTPIKAPKLCR